MPSNTTFYTDCKNISYIITSPLRHNKYFIYLDKMTCWYNLKALYEYLILL